MANKYSMKLKISGRGATPLYLPLCTPRVSPRVNSNLEWKKIDGVFQIGMAQQMRLRQDRERNRSSCNTYVHSEYQRVYVTAQIRQARYTQVRTLFPRPESGNEIRRMKF